MRRILAIELLRALSARMTRWELMQKFGLSARELDRIIDCLLSERRSRALRILADLGSGMPVSEIAAMNGFPVANFGAILKKLKGLGMLHRGNVIDDNGSAGRKVSLRDRRSAPRVPHPLLVTQVFEANEPGASGLILDLSHSGLRIRGIEAHVDEMKNLVVHPGDFSEAEALTFECRCRWISSRSQSLFNMKSVAGFEITSVSPGGTGFLKLLLDSEFDLTEVA